MQQLDGCLILKTLLLLTPIFACIFYGYSMLQLLNVFRYEPEARRSGICQSKALAKEYQHELLYTSDSVLKSARVYMRLGYATLHDPCGRQMKVSDRLGPFEDYGIELTDAGKIVTLSLPPSLSNNNFGGARFSWSGDETALLLMSRLVSYANWKDTHKHARHRVLESFIHPTTHSQGGRARRFCPFSIMALEEYRTAGFIACAAPEPHDCHIVLSQEGKPIKIAPEFIDIIQESLILMPEQVITDAGRKFAEAVNEAESLIYEQRHPLRIKIRQLGTSIGRVKAPVGQLGIRLGQLITKRRPKKTKLRPKNTSPNGNLAPALD